MCDGGVHAYDVSMCQRLVSIKNIFLFNNRAEQMQKLLLAHTLFVVDRIWCVLTFFFLNLVSTQFSIYFSSSFKRLCWSPLKTCILFIFIDLPFVRSVISLISASIACRFRSWVICVARRVCLIVAKIYAYFVSKMFCQYMHEMTSKVCRLSFAHSNRAVTSWVARVFMCLCVQGTKEFSFYSFFVEKKFERYCSL